MPAASTLGDSGTQPFRRVNILALSDFHAYGNTAKMHDAWPQVVARETDRSVYNMGLGGYGRITNYLLRGPIAAPDTRPRRAVYGR
jgi:hypothetical protein